MFDEIDICEVIIDEDRQLGKNTASNDATTSCGAVFVIHEKNFWIKCNFCDEKFRKIENFTKHIIIIHFEHDSNEKFGGQVANENVMQVDDDEDECIINLDDDDDDNDNLNTYDDSAQLNNDLEIINLVAYPEDNLNCGTNQPVNNCKLEILREIVRVETKNTKKWHECEICEKKFDRPGKLARHLKVHKKIDIRKKMQKQKQIQDKLKRTQTNEVKQTNIPVLPINASHEKIQILEIDKLVSITNQTNEDKLPEKITCLPPDETKELIPADKNAKSFKNPTNETKMIETSTSSTTENETHHKSSLQKQEQLFSPEKVINGLDDKTINIHSNELIQATTSKLHFKKLKVVVNSLRDEKFLQLQESKQLNTSDKRENLSKNENHVETTHNDEANKNTQVINGFHRDLKVDRHDDNSKRRFKCELCQENFYRKSFLTYHIRRIHNKHSCNHCGKLFSHKHSLALHIRVHKGKNVNTNDTTSPTICSFSSQQLENVENYRCDICENIFLNNSELNNHKHEHIAFSTNSNLVNNKKLHNDKKDFECKMCNKSYDHILGLFSHSRSNLHKDQLAKQSLIN